jgi:hypothetical protein
MYSGFMFVANGMWANAAGSGMPDGIVPGLDTTCFSLPGFASGGFVSCLVGWIVAVGLFPSV